MKTITLFLLAFVALNAIAFCQNKLVTQATARLGLYGSDDKINTDRNITVVATRAIDCMEANASITPDAQIKVLASSKECGNIHTPFASGSWRDQYEIVGGSGKNIPLRFNFELTGSQRLNSYPTGLVGCLSIASSSIHNTIRVGSVTAIFYSDILYQLGAPYSVSTGNFDKEAPLVKLRMVVAAKLTPLDKIPLKRSWFPIYTSEFLDKYNVIENKSLSGKLLNYLTGGIPIAELKSGWQTVSEEKEKLAQVLNLLSPFLSIPTSLLGIKLDVNYEVQTDFISRNSIQIDSPQKGDLSMLMIAQASTSPCGDAAAVTDFYNTLKLKSVTLPEDFYDPSYDISKLRIKFSSFELPINYDIVTSIISNEELERKISLSPNPVNNVLTFKFPSPLLMNRIEIFNLKGEILFSDSMSNGKMTEYQLSIKDTWPNGIYLTKFNTSIGVFTKRIMVSK